MSAVAQSLVYPIRLARRRPNLGLVLVLTSALCIGAEIAFATLGVDLFGGASAGRPIYLLVLSLLQTFAFGWFMAEALIDLDARPSSQKAGPLDGVALMAISLVTTLAALPIFIVGYLAYGAALSLLTPPLSFVLAAVAVVFFGAVLVAFATRLSFAGPKSLAEGRIQIFRTWMDTRQNFWRILHSYVLLWVVALALYCAVEFGWSALSAFTGFTPLEVVDSLPDALHASTLTENIIINGVTILYWGYLGAGAAHIYVRLKPSSHSPA